MKTNFTFFANLRKKTFLLIVFVIFFNLHNHAQYCTATGGNCDDYINQVQFSNIDIWSWCESYRDFSNFQADVVLGVTYPINVRNNNHYLTDTCDVWIDWDQDGIFNDSTEYYRLLNDVNPYQADILVPVNATIGQTKMRIRIRREGIQTPCGDASQLFGEVEDYTVNVMSPVSMVMNYYNFIHKSGYTTAGRTEQTISGININTTGNVDNLYLKNLFFNTFNSNGNLDSYYIYYTGNNPDPDSYNNWFGNMSNYNGYQMQFTDSFRLQDGDNYFWLKYDISSTPNLGDQLKAVLDSFQLNDTIYITGLAEPIEYIEITTPLSGVYTINLQGNGDYLSFNEAVYDLVFRGISGPVVFNVDSGYYNEQIGIPEIYGSSSVNTITFQSSDSSYSSVLLEYSYGGGGPIIGNAALLPGGNYTINLNKVSNILFKDLSISSGINCSTSRVVLIDNLCDNVSFTGNYIFGSSVYNMGDEYALVFLSNSSQTHQLTFDNNIFKNGAVGIYSQNWNLNTNHSITNNTFLQQNEYGMFIYDVQNPSIINNIIISDNYNWYYNGIYLQYPSGIINVNQNRVSISNQNNISGISIYNNYSVDTNSLISNNFVTINSLYGNQAYGIFLEEVNSLKTYHNSINITGNNIYSSCINLFNSVNLNFRNNNLSNNAFGFVYSSNSYQSIFSDYNNLFSTSNIAHIDGNNYLDLPSWINFSTNDSNSLSVFPNFISDTNLHLTNLMLNNKGTPLTEVTVDIDNEPRDINNPDMGADEFNAIGYDLKIEELVNLPDGCGLTNDEPITVVIRNEGGSDYLAGNADVNFSLDVSQQNATVSLNRNILSGDSIHFEFPIGANLSVNSLNTDTLFNLQCWVTYSLDMNSSNDSIFASINSRYLPPNPIVTDTTINYATNVSLNAQVDPDYIPLWYDTLIGGNIIKNSNPLVTPVLYATDTFYVAQKKGGLNYLTIGNGTSTVGYPYYTYYHDSKTQMLYTAEELLALGLQPGNITSLSFNISSRASQYMYGFNIQMQNSTLNALTGFVNSGWSTVYSGGYSVPGTGWHEIVFQYPFIWDGISNILINICFDNTSYTSNSNVYSTNITGKVWHYHTDWGTGCSSTGGSAQNSRPNIRLKGIIMGNGCESNRSPLIVNVSNAPSKDLGVIAINTPVDGFEISSPVPVEITIKNYGQTAIDTFFVSYKKGNDFPVTEMIAGNLNPGSTMNYTFNQAVDITALGLYNFKAYTSVDGDTIIVNDTSFKNVQNFTYCQATYAYNCGYTSINNFILNNLNNSNSGCNTQTGSFIIYPENSYTTSLQKGVNYPFTINPSNNSYYNGYAIWIDLNHDGDFDDLDECVYYSYNTFMTQLSASIFISENYSYTGKTRMRVRALRNSYISNNQACTYFNEYGETEDYTISILPSPLQKDLQLLQVVKPDNSTYQLVPSDFIVKVKNIGLDTITQIPFEYIFNSDPVVNYLWNGELLPQQQLDITIAQLIANTASNDILVYSFLSGDLDNSNDTLYKSFTALPAPAVISIAPDSLSGIIASCDSNATQTHSFNIYNTGWSNLSCVIGSIGIGLVGDTSILIIQESAEWGVDMQSFILTNFGKTSTKINSSQIAATDFSQFDIIITVGNQGTTYYNNISNNKAKFETFVNNGGVLQYQLANYNGVTINLAGGVNAPGGNNETQNTSLLPTHPIVAGLPVTLLGNDANAGYFTNLPLEAKIITETKVSLKPTTIEYPYGNGLIIATTMTLGYLYNNGYNSGPILQKMAAYSISNIGLIPEWIILSTDSAVVVPSDSTVVDVTFKVGDLNAGIYNQNLIIKSTDPLQPKIILPVSLTIIGSPQIAVTDSIRDFTSIMAGAFTTEYMKIYNTGCDTLRIFSIDHTNPAFTMQYDGVVFPKDSTVISIIFNSLVQGNHFDTLTVTSNSDIIKLYLSGIILPTPQFVYNPDSVMVLTNSCNDTLVDNVLIKNEGNTSMSWEAYYSKGAENGVLFNGTTSQIQFGNLGAFPNQGTIEFWMKTSSVSGNKHIFTSFGNNGSNWKGINIYKNSNYLYLLIGNNSGSYYTSYQISNNIANNEWHHIAVSWDKNLNSIWTYLNGNMVQNAAYNIYWPTELNDVRLGCGYSTSSSYFYNGEIDEMRIWSEKRNINEIRYFMNQALIDPISSLIGLWGFNEVSGNIVYNFKENGYNGNLLNVTRLLSGANVVNPKIDVFPSNGVLAANDSINVDVTFITNGKNSGIHRTDIIVFSNDPLNKVIVIPTHLEINGNAEFSMQLYNIQIDSIMAGAITTDSVYVKNTGCDTLNIYSIANNNTAFSLDQSQFNILPNDSAKIRITFNPVNIDTYYDTLIFNTNAGNYSLNLIGVGMAAPIASVEPLSIIDTITSCNQTINRFLKIKNSGNEMLIWNALFGGTGIIDNFNTGITNANWSEITGGLSAASCGTALNSANALYFNGSSTRQAVTKIINTIGGGTVSYYLKISGSGGSPCEQADMGEGVVFEYSINNGSSWNTIQTLNPGSYSVFTLLQVAIPDAAKNFNTIFRWKQVSHSGSCCDHWAIDEVNINILNSANLSPSSGIVGIIDSTYVQVDLNGTGLINGNYNSQVVINTNDPLNSQIIIPVQLVVKANPIMEIIDNTFIMDTIMIGASTTKPLYIKNTGCDTLKINSVSNSLAVFSFNLNSLNIPPKDSAFINITFASADIGNYTDNLSIISNAGTQVVILKGKSVGAPQIITLPDFITTDFVCDSQKVIPFKIKNPGVVPLIWNAYVDKMEKGSLQFDGLNDYVNINSGYLSVNNWTVEAWVKPTDLSLGSRLIAGSVRSCIPWGLYMVNGKFAVIYRSNQNNCDKTLIADNFNLTINNWYHLACSYNGNVVRIYINGQLVKSVLENAAYNTGNIAFIGGDPNYSNRYFAGSIDEVRIWNKARTQKQLSFSMNYMLKGNENGLIGYWPINKLNGNSVSDFSPNNIAGILNNGVVFTENASPVIGSIELSNYSGNINVGDSTQLNLSINRHLLPQGSHTFKLIVQSDDPIKPYDTTIVTVNASMNLNPVDIGTDTTLCSGNTVLLNAGNYASYLWNNNTNSSTLNVNTSGSYYVTVSDANNCVYSDSILISVTPSPVADAGIDKAVCLGDYLTLNGNANGGTSPYSFSWRNNTNQLLSTVANYSFYPTQSSYYTLSVMDNNGCLSNLKDTVLVNVNNKPIVNAGIDTTINLGTSVVLNGSVSGGSYPYIITWSPPWNYSGYLSSTNILNPVANPLSSTNFILSVTDANNCGSSDNVQITVRYTLSGSVLYNNSVLTPIQGAKVYLLNNNDSKIDSTTTYLDGSYNFTKIPGGNYKLYALPNTSFGGVNSTDALGIRRHIVSLATISGVNLTAADVNNSNSVSSADALLVLRRTVGMISSFVIGDWTSELKTVYISTNTQNLDIKVLCYGDVNGSYIPFATKSTLFVPDLVCESKEKLIIQNQEVEIPIKYNNDYKIGAVTLEMNYPKNLIDILGVQSDGNKLEYKVSNGLLSLGFYNENGIVLNDRKLLNIKCRVKSDAQSDFLAFSLTEKTEFADVSGNKLSSVLLTSPCYRIGDYKDEFVLSDIYPNPFSNISTIRLFVPENAKVQLSILNILGENIKTENIQNISLGWNDIRIDATDLAEGAYMYRIQAVSQNKKFDQTGRMMIIR